MKKTAFKKAAVDRTVQAAEGVVDTEKEAQIESRVIYHKKFSKYDNAIVSRKFRNCSFGRTSVQHWKIKSKTF